MYTAVRGRHPAIRASSHRDKNADRVERVTASALRADWPLHGWRRGQGLSNRCFRQDSVREGHPLPDIAVSQGRDQSDKKQALRMSVVEKSQFHSLTRTAGQVAAT